MSAIRFDQALPSLVGLCEGHAIFTNGEVERACVVRDLQGRLRVAIKPKEGCAPDLQELHQTLDQHLSGYFRGPILSVGARDRPDEVRLAGKLLELSQPWEAEYQKPFTSKIQRPPDGRWRKLERRLAKQMWLDESRPGKPPWELKEGPAIVTFYSFKGGVGRTTALVSCAWQLARTGKRIAILDLDLEGPGAGALLEASSESGVIDFLVDHLATRSREFDGLASAASGLGELAQQVSVVPAGSLNLEYLEKLGRLDFQSSLADEEEESPTERGLRALLHAVRKELQPDFVFLDARSGLHDLAGLSLHGLAHIDALFTRASAQGYAGLDLTVQALARRRAAEDLLAIIVHAFAPRDSSSEVYKQEARAVLERSYESFSRFVYGKDAPALETRDAPHYPRPLRANTALERFTHLNGVSDHLLAEDYRALLDRVVELCEPRKESFEGSGG